MYYYCTIPEINSHHHVIASYYVLGGTVQEKYLQNEETTVKFSSNFLDGRGEREKKKRRKLRRGMDSGCAWLAFLTRRRLLKCIFVIIPKLNDAH